MARINILPEHLSNKIAAGEVVERPASVVKELLENALDAGSTRIFIVVENGGRGLIQVADNGVGMSHDDALLSIERYATSKILNDSDLFAIQTLGFRGEALPSIAAVSQFTLTTRSATDDTAVSIAINGGRMERVSETGAPVGTLIAVRRLFYNTPARRKFLKTVATEMGHIVETVSAMALGWPQVQIRLQHNEKLLKSWPKANPEDRVADVLGGGLRENLVAITGTNGDVRVDGWIGAPRITRSTSRGIYLFVNGRFVRDRVLQHAIFTGYAGRLVKGQYPVAVIRLEVPYDTVDVNVHPSKHEVRFAQQKKVHQAVADAVARALASRQRSGWYSEQRDTPKVDNFGHVAEKPPSFSASSRHGKDTALVRSAANSVESADTPDSSGGRTNGSGPIQPAPEWSDSSRPVSLEPSENTMVSEEPARQLIQASDTSAKAVQKSIWEKQIFSDLVVIGQFHGTYLICESTDGLVLIDQHAAHERIAYETLKRNFHNQNRSSQRLLLPETIELGFREAETLTRMLSEFSQLGLEIEPFGGSTFVVSAIPDLLSGRQIGPLVEALVEKIVDVGFGNGLEAILDQCLMVMACHSTIRANQNLSPQESRTLLAQLDRCEDPSHCPHGRPTWIQWHLKAVQKAFHRIV